MKFKDKLNKINFKYLLLSIGLFLFMSLLYMLTSLLHKSGNQINMKIDNYIPFISHFVYFYYLYYILPILFLWLLSFDNKEKFYQVFISLLIVVIVCSIIYIIYPVQIIRPEIKIKGLSSLLVNLVYKVDDKAINCLPSLHCVFSCGLIYSSLINDKLNIKVKLLSVFLGVMIILSTVFIKQHYIIDGIIGILLYFIIQFICKKFFPRFYIKLFKINEKSKK